MKLTETVKCVVRVAPLVQTQSAILMFELQCSIVTGSVVHVMSHKADCDMVTAA